MNEKLVERRAFLKLTGAIMAGAVAGGATSLNLRPAFAQDVDSAEAELEAWRLRGEALNTLAEDETVFNSLFEALQAKDFERFTEIVRPFDWPFPPDLVCIELCEPICFAMRVWKCEIVCRWPFNDTLTLLEVRAMALGMAQVWMNGDLVQQLAGVIEAEDSDTFEQLLSPIEEAYIVPNVNPNLLEAIKRIFCREVCGWVWEWYCKWWWRPFCPSFPITG